MKQKLIIVEHAAKEFANRLWSDMSIYAYGLEVGAAIANHTHLEHTRWGRIPHLLYARIVDRMTRGTSALWALGAPKFLPPSGELSERYTQASRIYFFGWLFRNPVGFERYRSELVATFGATASTQERIKEVLSSLPGDRVMVGVQIKQEPFKGFSDGSFLVSPARVESIVEEYLREKQLSAQEVVLVVATDKALPAGAFRAYTKIVSTAPAEMHLPLLSQCSVVIGTNSTLPNLAAWFGNVPHIVTKDAPIDWPYYKNKDVYFENKYANFAL